MSESMAGDVFVQSDQFDCLADRFLDSSFAQVMPPDEAGAGIGGEMRGRKNVLPAPLPAGVGIFSFKGVGQVDAAMTSGQVFFMDQFDPPEMVVQGLVQAGRQHGPAIFVALTAADGNLSLGKVNILHPQAQTFEEAQATAIQELD